MAPLAVRLLSELGYDRANGRPCPVWRAALHAISNLFCRPLVDARMRLYDLRVLIALVRLRQILARFGLRPARGPSGPE